MSKPRVLVTHRSRYAEVVIDLWPCDFNLTDDGADRCRELLEAAARRAATKNSSVFFSAGRSIVQITRVRRDETDALTADLLAIVTDPQYQEPIRNPVVSPG